MIDRNTRDTLAELLHRFVAGRLTNDEFSDRVPASDDQAVPEITRESWYLYDDLQEHRLTGKWRIGKPGRTEVARWILFLKTDLQYEWPRVNRWLLLVMVVPNLLTIGLLGVLLRHWYATHGDFDVWPFMRSEDFETALRTPIYFGRTA
jgi:hypothetical protein